MLYEVLITSKFGAAATVAAPDMYTGLLAQKMPFAKGAIAKLTGIPPLMFKCNGQPLLDWSIRGAEGGVGDKTYNLLPPLSDVSWVPGWFDAGVVKPATSYQEKTSDFIELPGELQNITVYSPDGFPYTSSVTPWVRLGFFDADNNYLSQSTAAGNVLSQGYYTFNIIPENSTKVRLSCRTFGDNFRVMLNVGELRDFEPYGYKIPISCGSAITNIYINSPLAVGETISTTDAGVQIPTARGNNILTVGTTVQPSVYIKYKK